MSCNAGGPVPLGKLTDDPQTKKRELEIANEAMSFFFDTAQRQIVEEALSLVELDQEEKTRARRRAAALAEIAGWFVANRTPMPGFGG